MTPFGSFAAICRMIKIEHSIFALPFAFAGAFIASGGIPAWKPFVLLTIAMVAVRSFAMAFNRVVDLPFDRRNPRTQNRPLVTGEITRLQTWAFIVVMAVVFVLACAGLNRLCLMLSPLALGISALYSVMKRFTWLCHFVLGAVLGLAPLAGWLSVDPVFTLPAVLLFWGVLFWVAGFDILYSCQDTALAMPAGSATGPTMKNSLEPTRARPVAQPSSTAFFSALGPCTITMSTSPALSAARASPVPALRQHRAMPLRALHASPRAPTSPNSPGLPVASRKACSPFP